ncbi:MAG: aminotransferase class IV [Candidatus Nanopelagicales bacterium]
MRFWVNGRIMPAEQATVAVLDHGFTVGDGVFETLKTAVADREVVPFALDRHVRRLARSAVGMGMPTPDADEVRTALAAVCAANPDLAEGGRLRVTYTSGPGPLGSERTEGAASLVVACSAAHPWPATTVLALCPWPRNERSPVQGLKSTSYAENVLALAHARSVGAGEALLSNLRDEVCEGTGSNIFLVIDDELLTPPLASGCLAGITRELVVEWCQEAGIDVTQRPIPDADLGSAQEIFITSSTRDVHPVSAVVDRTGAPRWQAGPAPRTAEVAALYAEQSAARWNP